MYAQGYSNTEGNTVLYFLVTTSMKQVLNLYSLSRVASVLKPAVAHRSLPGMNAPWAGSGVTPLVRPACKPCVCPALSKEGWDPRCRADWPPCPGAVGERSDSHQNLEVPALRGIHAHNMVQRNDELETSPSSFSTLIPLQRLVHFFLPPICCLPAFFKVSCDFVTF